MKKIILILIVMGLTPAVFAEDNRSTASLPVSNVDIQILGGTSSRQEKLSSLANKIVRIKKGEPLSSQALFNAIEILKQTGQFNNIDVPDPEPVQNAVIVRFLLTPTKLIRKIDIKGAFTL